MPEIVNTDGLRVKFLSAGVAAVTDHDEMNQPQTCVYGILNTAEKIAETVDGFLTRLAIKDKFVQFTRPSGFAVWINVDAVSALRQSTPADAPGASCVISAGGLAQAVKETIDAVATALNAKGGKF